MPFMLRQGVGILPPRGITNLCSVIQSRVSDHWRSWLARMLLLFLVSGACAGWEQASRPTKPVSSSDSGLIPRLTAAVPGHGDAVGFPLTSGLSQGTPVDATVESRDNAPTPAVQIYPNPEGHLPVSISRDRRVLTPDAGSVATPLVPRPMPTPTPVVYTVQAGDTLSGIAGEFGLTLEQLVEANRSVDPGRLQIGQQLAIPSEVSVPQSTSLAASTVSAPTVPSTLVIAAPDTIPFGGLTGEVVVAGLERPVYVGHAGDGSDRLFVVEKAGKIRLVIGNTLEPVPFLDITAVVGSREYERGLLGLAFHPDYVSNGRFFVHYTDVVGASVIAEYSVSDDRNRGDPLSAQVLLTQPQPFPNHNGGMLAFGPDGMLYVALGDGGSAGDPNDNGQRLDTLLGKLLRLDVSVTGTYSVPAGNPFVGRPGARPEIWSYGLRNPWRFSFDRATGDLYIADVGQNSFEEVDFAPASSTGGENYGWRLMEGRACFRPAMNCDGRGLVEPIAVYGRDGGCSVTGGYVYRGVRYPALTGAYLFGDYCSGIIWTLRRDVAHVWHLHAVTDLDMRISSFGEDMDGEMYITDDSGGRLLRLRANIS